MRKLLFFLLLSFFTSTITAQEKNLKKYYKNKEDKIITEKAFKELKEKVASEFKKQLKQDVIVNEVFGDVEMKGDSVIFNYQLKIIPLSGKVSKRPNFGEHLIHKELEQATLASLDNSYLKLEDLKGKPTMINFWFTSCKPCIDEMPVLNQIRKKYADRVNFISITFDKAERVRTFLEKYDFDFDHYVNAKNYIDTLGIAAYPTSLFIDKNGVVKFAEGGIPMIVKDGEKKVGDGKFIQDILEKLLK